MKTVSWTAGWWMHGGIFSRAWVDSPGEFGKNGVALPMPAMDTEMKLQQTTRSGRAFTLIEMLAVICVLALVAAFLLPILASRQMRYARLNCVNNLKQVGLSFRIWEGDNDDKFPMRVSVTNGGAMELALNGDVSAIFRVMSNELSTPKILVCPEDAGRHYATNFTTDFNNSKISYFVALDAEDKYPQMILSGDDNLEVNGIRVRPGVLDLSTNTTVGWTKERIGKFHGLGNIGLTDGSADGSVRTITASALQSALVNTGTATNRLVIP